MRAASRSSTERHGNDVHGSSSPRRQRQYFLRSVETDFLFGATAATRSAAKWKRRHLGGNGLSTPRTAAIPLRRRGRRHHRRQRRRRRDIREGGTDILVGAQGNDGWTARDARRDDRRRGNDVFVLRKGRQWRRDLDFNGNGAGPDSIQLAGYEPAHLHRLGTWTSTDNDHGFIEHVTIYTPGPNVIRRFQLRA